MFGGSHDRALEDQGFRLVGTLTYQLHINLWWHEGAKIHAIVLDLGSGTLLKGSKAYYVKSVSEEGKTWARDIGPLHDYLEAHFPEIHLTFCHFRDVPRELVRAHIHKQAPSESATARFPSVRDLERLQEQSQQLRREAKATKQLLDIESGKPSLLRRHLANSAQRLTRSAEQAEDDLAKGQQHAALFDHLQREYMRKGSAACLEFSISSAIQIANSPGEFGDALRSVTKELNDFHRFQVTQKLGGRLSIQVDEAEEPSLIWIEEWLGGALSPRQLSRLEAIAEEVRDACSGHLMVSPGEDIRVDGHIREDKKLVSARVLSSLLRRVDTPAPLVAGLQDAPANSLPVCLGRIVEGDRVGNSRCILPLARFDNCYISGATGGGKSYLGRVLVEEAASHEDLSILVLDPRNQAAGLLMAENREEILSKYGDFGLRPEDARAFAFDYYAPDAGLELPRDLGSLARGRQIVSFKGLDDTGRCLLFSKILDAIFDAIAGEESESVRLLLVIEEAQRFTRKRVPEEARSAGIRAENALDRTVREGRKYGCCTVVISQTIRDFAYDTASVRQNTNTKAFLRNSDREVDYAASFLGDGRQLIRLTPGRAIVHNSAWGTVTVQVRPPLSKVWELSEGATRSLLGEKPQAAIPVSEEASRLLEVVRGQVRTDGHAGGLNLSQAAQLLGLTSRRRLQQLVQELEGAGLVATRKLRERGQPRVIEPVSLDPDQTPDATRTEGGAQ